MQHVRAYILMTGLAAFNMLYLTEDFNSAFNFLCVSVLQLHCLKLNSLCYVTALCLFRMLLCHEISECT